MSKDRMTTAFGATSTLERIVVGIDSNGSMDPDPLETGATGVAGYPVDAQPSALRRKMLLVVAAPKV